MSDAVAPPLPLVFHHAAALLCDILTSRLASEAVMKQYFRHHPEWGKNDRAHLADVVMQGFRHLRERVAVADALGAWLGNPDRSVSGEVPAPWRLALAEWLMRVQTPSHQASKPTTEARPDNVPDWLWQKALAQHHADAECTPQKALSAYGERAPVDIRINPWRTTLAEARQMLTEAGFVCADLPHTATGLRLSAPESGRMPSLKVLPLFAEGHIALQDVGSQWISQAMPLKGRGGMWVDYCAGGGGKTLALLGRLAAQHRHHRSTRSLLLACDAEAQRLNAGRTRLETALAGADLGVAIEHVVLAEPLTTTPTQEVNASRLSAIRTLQQRYAGRAQGVLVDAPCSGLGTLRRAPELAWKLTPARLSQLIHQQQAILHQAAEWVAKGGVLLYATCSWLHEENQQVIETFLAEHPDFQPMALPEALQGLTSKPNAPLGNKAWQMRVQPYTHQSDGYYFALMARQK